MNGTLLRILGATGAAGIGAASGYALGQGGELDDPRATEEQKKKSRIRGALIGLLGAAPAGYFAPEIGGYMGLTGGSKAEEQPKKEDKPKAEEAKQEEAPKEGPGFFGKLSLPGMGENKDSLLSGALWSGGLHGGWQGFSRGILAGYKDPPFPGPSSMRGGKTVRGVIDSAVNPAYGHGGYTTAAGPRRAGRAIGISTAALPLLLDSLYNSNAK